MSTPASPEIEEGRPSCLPRKVFKGHTKHVRGIVCFRNGTRIASGSTDKTVRIWNAESGEQDGESLEHDFEVYCIAVSPDERVLVSGGGGVVFWDLERRTVKWTKEEGALNGFCVKYSSDGKLVAATVGEDIILMDAETGDRVREPLQFGESIRCFTFSLDGARIAAGSVHGKVRVFDVATGGTVLGPFHAHTEYVMSLAYTVDRQVEQVEQIITASVDKSIRVWDSKTGQETGEPMLGHKGVILNIALSPNRRRLASVAADTDVRVWYLASRRQIGDPLLPVLAQGEERWFLSVGWSPNGRFVVAGGDDGNVSLWDIPLLEDEDEDTTTPRPRKNSLSESLLDLPARAPPPNQPNSNPPLLRNDFFDFSDLDLPALARPQISTIPVPNDRFKPSTPTTTKAKTAPNVPPTSPPSANNILSRIGARFRRDTRAPETVEMQQPPRMPKYSPVGKIALAEADARLYVDKSKDKKPTDDESGQEEWADVKVNCWDIFRAMIMSCCSSRSDA